MAAVIIGDEQSAVQGAHKQSVTERIDRDARGFCQAGVAARPMLAIVGGAVTSIQIGAGKDVAVMIRQIVGVIGWKAIGSRMPRLPPVGGPPDAAEIGADKQNPIMGLNVFAIKALQSVAAGFPTLSAVGGAEDVFVGGDEDRVPDSSQRLGIPRGEPAIGERPAIAVVVADADASASCRVGGPVVAKQESDVLAVRTRNEFGLRRRVS